MRMAHTIGTILVVLALAATRALAQDDPRILFSGPEGFERNPIATALFNLGYLDTVGVFQREELLLPALRDGRGIWSSSAGSARSRGRWPATSSTNSPRTWTPGAN